MNKITVANSADSKYGGYCNQSNRFKIVLFSGNNKPKCMQAAGRNAVKNRLILAIDNNEFSLPVIMEMLKNEQAIINEELIIVSGFNIKTTTPIKRYKRPDKKGMP